MLDAKRLGIAGGIVGAVWMFLLTLIAMYTGYGAQMLGTTGSMYPGYSITIGGAIVGLIFGFIDGFLVFYFIGLIYNKLPKSRR